MGWPEYKSKYRQFLISIHQAQLTTAAAGAALESFPRNLPAHVAEGLSDAMLTVVKVLDDAIRGADTEGSKRVKFSTQVRDETVPVFSPMLNMYALLIQEGQSPDSVDFQSALYRQQLVMIIAHAEAFFGDSVRFICLARPELLESEKKQLSWSAALAFSDRDALRAGLIDAFVAGIMQAKDVNSLLAHLSDAMGLEVNVAAERTQQLSVAEQVRHVIVHNGGRVDRKFCQKTGSKLPVGQLYPVDKAFVDASTDAVLAISQALFSSVAQKFFGVECPLEEFGWRFTPDWVQQQTDKPGESEPKSG